MIKTIGIITSRPDIFNHYFPTLAEPDLIPTEPCFTPDDQLAINELRHHGIEVKPVVWGEPHQDLDQLDLLVVRSPWDYMETHTSGVTFSEWLLSLDKSGMRIFNPVPLLIWLLNKSYLQDLQQAGINVIPTTYLPAGSSLDLSAYVEAHGEFILKPTVSAAGMGLYHIRDLHDAKTYQSHIHERLAVTHYMLQPLIKEITSRGEWSIIFLGGQYSHAILKKPADKSIFVHAERGGTLDFTTQPDAEIIRFAKDAYHRILPAFSAATGYEMHATDLLYLRLDIIPTAHGPLLIECEGVEPELFFRADPRSATLFAQAMMAHLGG